MSLRVGSLFSGVGGFDLGLECAGYEVAWQVEVDKFCAQVLRARWPEVSLYGDVQDVGAADLDDVDLLCGGFPCQDLSVAGGRAGLGGSRSALFYEFVRIARALAPRWLCIENVPGMLSSHEGQDFAVLLREVTGFWPVVPAQGWKSSGVCTGPEGTATWRVLDTQYFGPPQRRERVFVVVDTARRGSIPVLLEPESLPGDSAAESSAWRKDPTLFGSGAGTSRVASAGSEAQFIVGERQGRGVPLRDERTWWDGSDKADTLDKSMLGKQQMMPGKRRFPAIIDRPIAFNATQDPVSGDKATGLSHEGAACVEPVAQVDKARTVIQQGRQFNSPQNLPNLPIHLGIPRRLTPVECERLHGFPDNWTATGKTGDGEDVTISDTQRYRQLGNAVSVPVAAWVGARIVAQEQGVFNGWT